ncbi:putative two-component system sensor kinase [Rhodococcus wratislaviensis]|uniref:histidine kinase n=1 Tax=Rhodococcus wratislaviensis TaxID=44752 RepID=A0A402C661_RHOWR|nr:HAMP domain-containing sensor histidine kinase [Rhodococcus wratislaviensis]GCE39072.1 putative two-component system sensor kinase [Rhodococcus wratislaviensis]
MRRRLLLILAILGSCAVASFAIPLAIATADSRTQEFTLGREGDIQRFAVLAEEYVRTGDPARIAGEVDAYDDVYGEGVLVVSTRGVPTLGVGLDGSEPGIEAAIRSGLRNERVSTVDRLFPWSDDDALFVKPVGSGAQVNGTIVLRASTAEARSDILRQWAVIAAGAVLALVAFGVLAIALSRWVLGPLANLSTGIVQLIRRMPDAGTPPASEPPPSILPVTAAGGPPEVRRLAHSFDVMSSAVLRAADAQQRLIADTAHQLRNPLAALQFRLDLLDEGIPDDAREDYHLVTEEAKRLQTILDSLLSLASAETPRFGAEATCDALSVVADRVDFWSVTARERGARLTTVAAPGVDRVPVAIAENDLSQVLDVLIDNASRYAGPHPTIEIGVGVERSQDHPQVCVWVADDGPGVPAELRGKLTDRFFRASDQAGTGLGLSIVEVVAAAYGGRLAIDEAPAGGLRVRLWLEPHVETPDDD